MDVISTFMRLTVVGHAIANAPVCATHSKTRDQKWINNNTGVFAHPTPKHEVLYKEEPKQLAAKANLTCMNRIHKLQMAQRFSYDPIDVNLVARRALL